MRLFIAINFNDETRARLISLREELCFRSTRGRFSLDENLHLTLAFIGEANTKQTDIPTCINSYRAIRDGWVGQGEWAGTSGCMSV